jgi:hypothetical protein
VACPCPCRVPAGLQPLLTHRLEGAGQVDTAAAARPEELAGPQSLLAGRRSELCWAGGSMRQRRDEMRVGSDATPGREARAWSVSRLKWRWRSFFLKKKKLFSRHWAGSVAGDGGREESLDVGRKLPLVDRNGIDTSVFVVEICSI